MSKLLKSLIGFKNDLKSSDSALNAEQLSHFDTPILKWKAPAFVKYTKNTAWYITTGTLLVILIGLGLLIGSATFAIAVIVFGMVYLFINQEDPEMLDVVISDIGIKFGNQVFAYNELKTFWIEYNPPYYQSLHLVHQKQFQQETTIHFHGLNPTDLRLILSQYLPEWQERKLTTTENIIKFLGL